MTTLHSRPFCLDHAKARAPIMRRDGTPATFVAHVPEAYRYEQVIYHTSTNKLRSIHTTSTEGRACHAVECDADLLMAPLGFIDGRPVFVGDEIFDHGERTVAYPLARDFIGCRWPEPEKQYPVTGMTLTDMRRVLHGPADYDRCVAIANAALRHAIDSGQLPTKEAYEQCARDLLEAESMLTRLKFSREGGKWHATESFRIVVEK